MEISTNVLLNYLRCRRYAALNYPDIDVIAKEKYFQNKDEYHQIVKDIFFAFLAEDYENILTSEVVSYDFHPDINLVEMFDFAVKDGDEIILYTVLPQTSRTLMKLAYKKDKHRYKLFKKNSNGIYEIMQEEFTDMSDTKFYYDRIGKLLSRHNDVGKLVYRYSYKNFIYEKAYPEQKFKHYFVLLNSKYVFDGVSYQRSMFHCFDFSCLKEKYNELLEVDLYRMINHIELNDFTPCKLVKKECLLGDSFECKFTNFCFAHISKEHSILNYFQSNIGFDEPLENAEIHHDTYDLLNEGVIDMQDVPISWLKNEKHLMQRYCVETNYTHINKKKVTAILKTLKFPLIYLDFEAFPCVLPRFSGETPYSQSVFQYSIHIEKKENKLQRNGKSHYEFVADPTKDERKTLLESMLKILLKYDSSIIVYNRNFEEQRLKEMKIIFPEYSNQIDNVIMRLFDLLDVVKNNRKFFQERGFSEEDVNQYNFYHPKLGGSYSLKKVVSVFDETAYMDFDIKNGLEAYKAYSRIPEMTDGMKEKTLKDLKKYCNQDTYSMFQILQGMKKLISPDFTIK